MRTALRLAILTLLVAAAAPAAEFYVAPKGDDAWSGRLPQPNRARTDGPFATLARARDAARALKLKGGIAEPVTVNVRAGTYLLHETLVFTAEDSGTTDCPVTFRSYPGETATLLGGKPVRGWQTHKGRVLKTSLADQGMGRFRFHQIFFRGKRQILARHPNFDPAHPHTGGMLYVDAPSYLNKKAFHYGRGGVPFEQWGDIPQAEVNIFPYNCWDHNIIRISRVDTDIRHIRLRHPVAGKINEANRYFIQNVLPALDAPGEWYVDYATGQLYFYPPGGEVADNEVVVPVVENLIQISGTAAAPVRFLHVRGFRFACAEQDGVTLEGAEHCEVTGNIVTNLGGVGINVGFLRNAKKGIGNRWFRAGRVRTTVRSGDRLLLHSHECTGCRIAGNDIYSVGGDGVVLVGRKNTADNNHIRRTGLFDMVCAGVTVYGEDNVVSHNEIHDVPRDGIFINGARNVAEYNSIRNTMLYTADNSAIALRQHGVARAVKDLGNVIRFNRILDTVGYGSYPHCNHPPKGFGSPYCSWGIYLDGSICGVTVYGNIIARSGANSIFIQFGGGNIVENNILVETIEEAIQYDSMVFFGWFMHSDRQGKFPQPPNEIKRNIFYYTGKNKKLYYCGLWGHPEWNDKQAVFDHNLIWHDQLPIEVALDKKRTYKSLDEWQATGRDQHSIIADPLFVDAPRDDYRLRPESPAFKLGFKNINDEIAKIGAYPSDERATWPLENAVLEREQPVVFEYRKPPKPIIDGFELAHVGSPPMRSRVHTEGAASVAVAAEAFSAGRHSLRFTDAAGLVRDFNPHVTYGLSYPDGRLKFSVDILNSKESPATWYMEFRDWGEKLLIGPTFAGRPDGTLTVCGRFGAGGERLGKVPNGKWFTVGIEFETGVTAAKTYTLTLKVSGEEPRLFERLPYADQAFAHPSWFGISSMSTEKTVLYVDNLILGPAGGKEMAEALSAPAIRGTKRERPNAEMRNKDKLALYWKFDEKWGDRLVDSSGNGLDGELGDVLRARGEFGRALYLDGAGAVAELEDNPLIQFGTSDFTVECWVCPTKLDVDSVHKRRRLIDKGLWPSTWWNVDILCEGRIRMEMADASKKVGTTESDGGIKENEWTHLVVVVDRANFQTRYYLDGELDSAKALPAAFTGNLDMPGKSFTTGSWQPFIGLMDELKVYRRALTPEQARQHFEQCKARYTKSEFTVEQD